MRHRKAGRKLSRTSAHRKAMLRNLVTSLLGEERVRTTDAKAKEVRRLAERMITLGKRGDLHARRQVAAVMMDKKVVAKLFERIAPRYAQRPGGYTRIIKMANRPGDNASQSLIELVEEEFTPKPKAAKPKPEQKPETKPEPTVDRKAEDAGPPAKEAAAEPQPAADDAGGEPVVEESGDEDKKDA